jgi:hypothetical protein
MADLYEGRRMFRTAVVGFMVAGACVVVPTEAEAAAGGCPKSVSQATTFTKHHKLFMPYKTGVHAGTKKHPYGWVTGRFAKEVPAPYDDVTWKPYGAKKTLYFAKKKRICVRSLTQENVWNSVSLAGFRKYETKAYGSPTFGFATSHGKATKLVEVFHP